MITLDCKDMRELMVEFAAYLSEKTKALPVIQSNKIVLDPLTEDTPDVNDVVQHVRTFLAKKDLSDDFIIKVGGEKIIIISISGRKVVGTEKMDLGLLECPHCGMVTLYEEEMNVHIKAHYFGF